LNLFKKKKRSVLLTLMIFTQFFLNSIFKIHTIGLNT